MTEPEQPKTQRSANRRDAILDTTEALMVKRGYAAVSVRNVAAAAGVKPTLIQYHFRSIDDLWLAVYRRAATRSLAAQRVALASSRPLHSLWRLASDTTTSSLAIEFMALAKHRPSVSAEIARYAGEGRSLQEAALVELLARPHHPLSTWDPGALSVLLTGFARTFVIEENMGVLGGHDAARAMIERWLDAIEPASD